MRSPKSIAVALLSLWLTAQAAFSTTYVTRLVADPYRPRVYSLRDSSFLTSGYPTYNTVWNPGSFTAFDTTTKQPAGGVTTGKLPSDLAISPDGSELAVIN